MSGTVPLLFDKSGFQGLNKREHSIANRYFIPNVTPVLVNEIVADVRKEYPKGVLAEDRVAHLAEKFLGSGTSVSASYRILLMGSLDGAPVPMTGQIIPDTDNVISHRPEDGSESILIDLGPANWLILRLASKQVTDEHRRFASEWRSATNNLSLAKLRCRLRASHVVMPRANTADDLGRSVDAVLDNVSLQDAWLAWLLESIPYPELRSRIVVRWQRLGRPLGEFAPYSHFCLRALLLLHAADQFRLIPAWTSTNLVDLQYLYYLPFCGVFVSEDRVHRVLAPHLLRPDQRFLRANEFKAGLARIANHLDSADDVERRQARSTPPALEGNVVVDAWNHVDSAWHERSSAGGARRGGLVDVPAESPRFRSR